MNIKDTAQALVDAGTTAELILEVYEAKRSPIKCMSFSDAQDLQEYSSILENILHHQRHLCYLAAKVEGIEEEEVYKALTAIDVKLEAAHDGITD